MVALILTVVSALVLMLLTVASEALGGNGPRLVAADNFKRTVTSGFGSAQTGGAWHVVDRAGTAVHVNAGTATVSNIPANSAVTALLPQVRVRDVQFGTTVQLPSTYGIASLYIALVARSQTDGSAYRIKLGFDNEQNVRLSIYRVAANGVETVLRLVNLPWKVTRAPIHLAMSITGSSRPMIGAKAWPEGGKEPKDWQATYTDTSNRAILGKGALGLWADRWSSAVNSFSVSSIRAVTTDSGSTTAPSTSASKAPSKPAPSKSSSPKPTPSKPAPSKSSSPKPTPSSSSPTSKPPTPPSSGSVPGPSNTGVPAGTVLKIHNGDWHITSPGVYSGWDVRGFLYIEAPNVTVKNSILRGGVGHTSIGLVNNYTKSANFVLENSELVPANPSVYIDGVQGSNYTLNRDNIHGTVDGTKVYSDNVTIENSYIHDLVAYAHDPYQSGGESHSDGIQVLGGHNLTFVNNNIMGGDNSALQFTQTLESVTNVTLSGNLLGGGACTVNLQDAPMTAMKGIAVANNNFSHTSRSNCAIIAFTGVNFQNTTNRWLGTSTPVNVIRR